MTTGTGIDRASLRPAPNTTVRDFVPHGSVLPHVDLAICHAGHGTVMAALAHGVPLLCLPMGRDQPMVAQRVEAFGAGRTLAPESDAATIRRVVAEALVDAAVRDGAREIASLIARRDGAAIAAEHLLAMLQSARTPRSFAHR
jgi:MGT family glycosyltransferase